ncbi:MAG: peptide chain release factor 2 [Spirochaetia bacterium]
MLLDWRQPILTLQEQINSHWGIFDSQSLRREVSELEKTCEDPEFWHNREKAEKTLSRIKHLKSCYEPWEKLITDQADLQALLSLALEAKDEAIESEIKEIYNILKKEWTKLTTLELLCDEADSLSCYLTIHAGAGGTEACDWARMLFRMYMRYIERTQFQMEIVDEQTEEAGIKSITLEITGTYAYGFLKGETGVHRLVRISPFDSNARRHTSFASVYVSPMLDETISVDVRSEDIRVDTYRASGAGGQKVNKTSSAVRMTHLETGIVVQCQNERSQHRNRDIAMNMLKGRLYEHYKRERDAARAKTAVAKHEIGFGNQIRSYVFHPYSMVKDQRTKEETSQAEDVMDGKIQPFIDAYLRQLWGKPPQEQSS